MSDIIWNFTNTRIHTHTYTVKIIVRSGFVLVSFMSSTGFKYQYKLDDHIQWHCIWFIKWSICGWPLYTFVQCTKRLNWTHTHINRSNILIHWTNGMQSITTATEKEPETTNGQSVMWCMLEIVGEWSMSRNDYIT